MARVESCLARPGVLDAYFGSPPTLFIHSQYMLHHGAGYTRLHHSDGVLGKQSYPKWDMINCFYFVSFVSSPLSYCFFFFFPSAFYLFYISRTAIRDLHCCNGWLF